MNFFYHVRLAILWFATIVIGGCLALGQVARPVLTQLEDAAAKIAKGDLTSAESQLQNVLDTDTNNYQAMNLLGVVRAQQHREADAEKLFKRVIVLKPSFSSARVNLGHLYAQMDRNDDAIAQLCAALFRFSFLHSYFLTTCRPNKGTIS